MLFLVPLAGVVGASASAPSVNIASMMNSGIDFQIINKGKLTKDLKYDLTWNSSFLKNEISSLAPNVTYFEGTTYRGISPIRNAVGQSISSFFGYEVIGAIQPQSFEEPSPKDIAALIDQVKSKKVKAVFGSEVFPSPVLEQIGKETGVRYIDVLRDDDLPGEPGDAEHSWAGLMKFNYITIVEALGGDATALKSVSIDAKISDNATYLQ